ncbi:hypothetical protein RM863_11705 [Streptomyces sp. DSM 41014]|uniref:Uncharacterized protein n=1 Tax=Streptomyces hintoniae TaxID=3075521 RepID=A0ABU2UHP4_9ACTN|nr:hypothetical protein [Streptomyces sp. DSM 41014]MDT0472791.1 hypothetical protein [Streptomyces sp. DSM 41014]
MKKILKASPARFHALLVIATGLIVAYEESGKVGLAVALLGLGGEIVQRVENGKTVTALHEPSPFEQ